MEAIGGPDWKGRQLELPDEGPGSLARFWRRFGGLLIDAVILAPVAIVGLLVRHPHMVTRTAATGLRTSHMVIDHPTPLFTVFINLPGFIYVVGLIAWRGQTVGEQAMGLRVIRLADRQHPGLTPALARWLVLALVLLVTLIAPRYSGWASLWTLLVYLWAAWDPQRQGLHDKFAGVIVVRTR